MSVRTDVPVLKDWRFQLLVGLGFLFLAASSLFTCTFAYTEVLAAQDDVHFFEPSEDAYVSQLNRKSNYGRDEVISIRSYRTAKESLNHRIYLKFDLKDLGQELYVASAILHLYKYIEGNHVGVRDIEVKRVLEQWSELSITWSNKPGSAGKSTNTVAVYGVGYWYQWDVSPDIRAWVNEGVQNNGFCLMDLEEDSTVDYASVFFSREAAEMRVYRPRLEVTLEHGRAQPLPVSSELFSVAVLVIGGIVLVTVAKLLKNKSTLGSGLDSTRFSSDFSIGIP